LNEGQTAAATTTTTIMMMMMIIKSASARHKNAEKSSTPTSRYDRHIRQTREASASSTRHRVEPFFRQARAERKKERALKVSCTNLSSSSIAVAIRR
jgi:hypothetical protein